ncbi:single-stranded DNA-binding protein [candidate division KSB1 bacterium]|nr:single-stranded DNA-binding protein [candidate division KSB1 bacterium]RQW06097.1 MAG: single-stranded DNA-binding protein [candidate division KSB1 bacterium]
METKNESEGKRPQDAETFQYSENFSELSYPDINRVFIAGTLLHDPPLRRTRKGVPVTNFIVVTKPDSSPDAANGFEREPVYISVVVWAKQAVQCSKHLKKGSAVIILGELQSMPNANPDEGFTPVQISAQWIQYLEKGKFSKITIEEDDADK